jgi:hypothetical protein
VVVVVVWDAVATVVWRAAAVASELRIRDINPRCIIPTCHRSDARSHLPVMVVRVSG